MAQGSAHGDGPTTLTSRMTDRPPSPPTPTTVPTIAPRHGDLEDRLVVTTSQLAARLEDALGYCPDEETLEDVLVELDRGGYLEWITITRDGDYVWDFTAFPDRLAEAVVAHLRSRMREAVDR